MEYEGSVMTTLPDFFVGYLVLAEEGVSDGGSDPEKIVGVEFVIVGNDVIVGFGANEVVFPEVIAHAHAEVNQEVIGVEVGATASGRKATTSVGGIEQKRLATHARHEVAVRPGRHPPLVKGVHVIQDRAVGLIGVVEGLVIAERAFEVEAKMILGDVLQKHAGINASPQRGGDEPAGSGGIFGRPESVSADGEVNLLSVSEAGEEEKCDYESKQNGRSQPCPL